MASLIVHQQRLKYPHFRRLFHAPVVTEIKTIAFPLTFLTVIEY